MWGYMLGFLNKYAFGYDDFVVGPAILIKKQALKQWAN